MEEKEFQEHLQNHRKKRNKKIISYPFLIAVFVLALLAIFFIIIGSGGVIGGGSFSTYEIDATVPYAISDSNERIVNLQIPCPIFCSSNPRISWSAYYEPQFSYEFHNSPAPLRFKIDWSTDYVNTTTSSYDERLSNIHDSELSFTWSNEDITQDVLLLGEIQYYFDFWWGVFFILIGIVIFAYLVIFGQKTYNRLRQKNLENKEENTTGKESNNQKK